MRRLLATALLLLLPTAVSAQDRPPSPLKDEERALFAWFDELGLPRLEGTRELR